MEEKVCSKCNGTGKVRDKDGTIHACWDCLETGEFDQHSKNIKESGIRI